MTTPWTTAGSTTIPALLRAACARSPDAVFLDFSGRRFSFAETREAVARLANGLVALGVQPGERVCSLLDNVPEAVFLWFAVNEIGGVYVPINTDYKGDYLRHQIHDAGARVIVTEADYADRVIAIATDLPDLESLFVRGDPPAAAGGLGVARLETLYADNAAQGEHAVAPSDLAMLIYTSGTTGPSKGCMVSHGYACNFARQNQWHTRLAPGDVLWTPSPLFHANAAFGTLLNALMAGATASIYPRFSVSNFWPEMERSGATHVSMLSVMLTLVPAALDTEASRRCHGQIRVLFGAPLNAALKARWRERFGVHHAAQPGYGMTEACMITLSSCYEDAPDGASGKRHADFDVRILDDAGNECPPGVAGEIVVRPLRPDVMFQGYWRRLEATAAATRNLWFHTGDIGRFDADDFFYFVDRKKDYLRRGGENISSFEVEATFRAHPDLAEVAVHSVASDLAEDELKLTAILKDGASLSEEELCRWSIDRLPHFVVPRFIEFRSAFPTTPTGKIQKHILRSDGVTTATWDRTASTLVVARARRTAGAL